MEDAERVTVLNAIDIVDIDDNSCDSNGNDDDDDGDDDDSNVSFSDHSFGSDYESNSINSNPNSNSTSTSDLSDDEDDAVQTSDDVVDNNDDDVVVLHDEKKTEDPHPHLPLKSTILQNLPSPPKKRTVTRSGSNELRSSIGSGASSLMSLFPPTPPRTPTPTLTPTPRKEKEEIIGNDDSNSNSNSKHNGRRDLSAASQQFLELLQVPSDEAVMETSKSWHHQKDSVEFYNDKPESSEVEVMHSTHTHNTHVGLPPPSPSMPRNINTNVILERPNFERKTTERIRNGFGNRTGTGSGSDRSTTGSESGLPPNSKKQQFKVWDADYNDPNIQSELAHLLQMNKSNTNSNSNGGALGGGYGYGGAARHSNSIATKSYGTKEFFQPLNDLRNGFGSRGGSGSGSGNMLTNGEQEEATKMVLTKRECFKSCSFEKIKTTIMGSIVFVLFHIVFCLAQASAIHRPYSNQPVFGHMVRMSAISPIVGGPLFIYLLSGEFPAVYPTIDAFPAPFFSQMAAVVDRCLTEAGIVNEEDDIVFLTTFGVLSAISLIMTGLLVVLGTKIKLVNLSAFLPYPVMCGFFSGVGVLLWTLSFLVDTGANVWSVLFHGGMTEIIRCSKHHVGSLIVGASMFAVGKVNSAMSPLVSLVPIVLVYSAMYIFGVSLQEARNDGWFWKLEEFAITKVTWDNIGDLKWQPPLPFGIVKSVIDGKVHWPAVFEGLPIALSMAVIFFIRCSIHPPALRKSSKNLAAWQEEQEKLKEDKANGVIKVGDDSAGDGFISDEEDNQPGDIENTASIRISSEGKKSSKSMADVLYDYGKVLMITGISGGVACLPSIGAGGTMYKLGAGYSAPQYGSIILLAIFYLTQFNLVGFLPKMIFSSLLVTCSLEMIETWFLNSYQKTSIKSEWMVVPVIVVLTFVVGVLQSVFMGLAMSTFIFVGTFFRSGPVKFIATGLTVHSTTERNIEDCEWLDQHGDLIQILVLQSHIFFGNANSCLSYVTSMFEEPETVNQPDFPLPPLPKHIIIDMTLVSGIDTSAVDIIAEMVQLCHSKNCHIMLAGLTPELKRVLALGKVKPSASKKSPYWKLRYPPDMESALCKAEDGVLKTECNVEEKEMKRSRQRRASTLPDGFHYALHQIDLQHNMDVANSLISLRSHASIVDLKAGDSLFRDNTGVIIEERGSGLFFIEHGMINVERDSSLTHTRGSTRGSRGSLVSQRMKRNNHTGIYATPRMKANSDSLTGLQARTGTIGREAAILKKSAGLMREQRTVRLARLKPGFVIGALGDPSSLHSSGDHIAVTPCRLHHISQIEIEKLEENNPRIVLELFKMMSTLQARKQEITISQLTTMTAIMTSLAPTKPVGRITMAAIKHAVGYES